MRKIIYLLLSLTICSTNILNAQNLYKDSKEQLDFDVNQIINVLKNQEVYLKMSSEGQSWSRQFTTDKFEIEIKKLLRG